MDVLVPIDKAVNCFVQCPQNLGMWLMRYVIKKLIKIDKTIYKFISLLSSCIIILELY